MTKTQNPYSQIQPLLLKCKDYISFESCINTFIFDEMRMLQDLDVSNIFEPQKGAWKAKFIEVVKKFVEEKKFCRYFNLTYRIEENRFILRKDSVIYAEMPKGEIIIN